MKDLDKIALEVIEANYNEVICPGCMHQFRAIPVNVQSRIVALEAEVAQWKTWGIIEVAIRNPSVSEYMRHWEGRTEKAEAEVARLTDSEKYAWKNTHILEKAMQEEMRKRDVAEAENTKLQDALRYVGKEIAEGQGVCIETVVEALPTKEQ